jgi:hypothetical protein
VSSIRQASPCASLLPLPQAISSAISAAAPNAHRSSYHQALNQRWHQLQAQDCSVAEPAPQPVHSHR